MQNMKRLPNRFFVKHSLLDELHKDPYGLKKQEHYRKGVIWLRQSFGTWKMHGRKIRQRTVNPLLAHTTTKIFLQRCICGVLPFLSFTPITDLGVTFCVRKVDPGTSVRSFPLRLLTFMQWSKLWNKNPIYNNATRRYDPKDDRTAASMLKYGSKRLLSVVLWLFTRSYEKEEVVEAFKNALIAYLWKKKYDCPLCKSNLASSSYLYFGNISSDCS